MIRQVNGAHSPAAEDSLIQVLAQALLGMRTARAQDGAALSHSIVEACQLRTSFVCVCVCARQAVCATASDPKPSGCTPAGNVRLSQGQNYDEDLPAS
jgi:hypothetical protein